MIDSGNQSAFPLLLDESHLRVVWDDDDSSFAVRMQVACIIYLDTVSNRGDTCFDVMAIAPFLGTGLVVNRNAERSNKQPNNVAIVSKHPRCCKEGPEMKQSDGVI